MPDKPKVAIVHDFLLKLGGAENLLLQLLKIFPDADLFTLLYDQKGTKATFSNFNITTSFLQKHPTRSPKNFKFLLPKFPEAIERFDLSAYDLVISHSNSFAHGVITSPKTLHLCYCLSPARYLYDWKNEYLEENGLYSGLKSQIVKKILFDLRLWDQQAASRPDRYLAISEHVKKRIKKYYRLDSTVVYPAVDLEKFKANFGTHEDYYIIISRLTPYKMIDLAIEAFNQNGKSLVVIGIGEDMQRLKKMAKVNIEFLGWQSDKSLVEYLRNAKALIFPGEEDFGLTPVESLACGTPVIALKRGGVTETVREHVDGEFFIEPTSMSLDEAISKFESFSSFDAINLRKRAEHFGFEHFKNSFQEIIGKLYGKKR